MSGKHTQDPNSWWSELNHGGMLLSPAILKEFLPEGPNPVDYEEYRKLRDAYTAFESWIERRKEAPGDNSGLYRWLNSVLDGFLDYPAMFWQKENAVSDEFKFRTSTGERLRPNRVLLDKGLTKNVRFLVKVDTRKGRLGMGKGRVEYSKFLTLLRGTDAQLGILTNGSQFRLAYAGMDYDCWVEWDSARWFEEESGISQLEGFVALCGKGATYRTDEQEFPLLSAVLRSRDRQGDLSQVLGEQVRLAVEKLLSSFDKAVRTHPSLLDLLSIDPSTKDELKESERLEALYHSAVRVIMRIIVILFAEARELLPKTMEEYHSSYGIEGLYASLEEALRHEGRTNLRGFYSAWPRILGLFRLVHEGSSNEDIPVPRYGSELFRRGEIESSSPVLRALAIFEDKRWSLNDLEILEILRLLKIGKVRARRGRTSTWVSGPVDFSDLRTEYIGMMYEGLLDYQLRQVTEDQKAVILLNLGQQPALPLSLLESLSDKELRDLILKLKAERETEQVAEESQEGIEGEEGEMEILQEEHIKSEATEEAVENRIDLTDTEALDQRILVWANRAVEIAGLMKRRKGKRLDNYACELEKRKIAEELVLRSYGPGEMYLVRSTGTRKGTGTFYTRPQLVVPTVHRTLEPLAYENSRGDGVLIPKGPEEVLSLKVVDPAMGSGSFLVGALRYLTDAIYESLLYHKGIKEVSNVGCVVTLPQGKESKGEIQEELLPVGPDDERFEHLLKARLKRHVVERCIYGVDVNPLAVELARLSLWIETMDRELPFEFLAHKLKVGNSLVGCWLDRFEDYPVLAWAREGGDGPRGALAKKIKSTFNELVKPEMRDWIQRMGPQKKLTAWAEEESPIDIQDQNSDLYSRLHELKRDERERFFRENIQDNENLRLLKRAMDRWCAIWFWPVHDENLQSLTPDAFYQPDAENEEAVEDIAKRVGFFHWELEFPDVFTRQRPGFDALVGNPPWDTLQPSSMEFFTRYDPIYRTYGKQEALTQQRKLFESHPTIEQEWLLYLSYYKEMSNWVKNAAHPFGDPHEKGGSIAILQRGKENLSIHKTWRGQRIKRFGYVSSDNPFQHLGSGKPYTYKMFLDLSYSILGDNGRLGMIVPSSLYTDKGSESLRKLFLERCQWEWLFGFENRKRIFDIDNRFKFCAVIIEKGGATQAIKSAFMRHDLIDWEAPDRFVISYDKEFAGLFSPVSQTILEIKTEKDLKILEKVYKHSVLLGDSSDNGWKIRYAQGDFNMTTDSKLFSPVADWLGNGYMPDDFDRWVDMCGNIALPLYEGRMVGQFDFSEKGWVSGKGRSSIWRDIPHAEKRIDPQYLLGRKTYDGWEKGLRGPKLAFMSISSATNTRTMICVPLLDIPCNHSLGLLQSERYDWRCLNLLSACLNSFTYDFVVRVRLGGLNLSYFVIEETPLIRPATLSESCLATLTIAVARLAFIHNLFAPNWLLLLKEHPELGKHPWKSWWAITEHERLRLRCILDAIVAELYGLSYDDLAWILRDDPSDPKGFWRVDKGKPETLRQTTLTLLAFKRLKEVGLESFCEEGWQFPGGIQEELGSRFLPWQDGASPEETWLECEQHARKLLGEEGYEKFCDSMNKAVGTHHNEKSAMVASGDSPNGEKEQKPIIQWED